MPKVYLVKDLLAEVDGHERVCGKQSVIMLNDMNRYTFLKETGHIRDASATEEVTYFPPPPAPKRNEAFDEIGQVVANAIKAGLTFPAEKQSGTKSQ